MSLWKIILVAYLAASVLIVWFLYRSGRAQS